LEKFKQQFEGGLFTPDLARQLEVFIAQLENMPDSVQRTQLAISQLGDALGLQVIGFLQAGGSAKDYATALGQVIPLTQQQIQAAAQHNIALNQLSAAWNQFKAEVAAPILTPVFQFLTDQVNKLTSDIRRLTQELQFAKAVLDVFSAPEQDKAAAAKKAAEAYAQLGQTIQATGQAGEQAGGQIVSGMNVATQATEQLNSTIRNMFDTLAEGRQEMGKVWTRPAGNKIGDQSDLISRLIATVDGLAQQQSELVSQIGGLMQQGSAQKQQRQPRFLRSVPEYERIIRAQERRVIMERYESQSGLASGGLLGGRGTGTSDSNLAWVSRGEHIMPARAVRQPGVLAFLEALRRSGGNLNRVLDGMGRFALGGLVPRSAMAFAGGGTVGMSNVTIQFPGVPPIGGLRASSAVVDELRRTAALAQVRSGGRKPSRYS
jgi:hypothetical protein